jgi:hypothetical protein
MPSSKKRMHSESKSLGAKFPIVSKQSESQVAPTDLDRFTALLSKPYPRPSTFAAQVMMMHRQEFDID